MCSKILIMKKNIFFLTILFIVNFTSCVTSTPKNINKKLTLKKIEKKNNKPIEPKITKTDIQKINFITVCENKKINASKIANNKILFVDISATWCEPCKKLANYVEQLKNKFGNKVKFIKVFPLIDKSKINCENSDKNTFFTIEKQEAYPRVIIFDKKGNLVVDETGLYPLLYYFGTLSNI